MPIKTKYERPEIVAGDLNTPVTFFEVKPNDGPEPGEQENKELYYCTCLVYNPSSKDRDILSGKGTKKLSQLRFEIHSQIICQTMRIK